MNRIYKLVWSRIKGCYIVASELAKSRGKAKRGAILCALAVATSLSLATVAEAETLGDGSNIKIDGDKGGPHSHYNAGVVIIGRENTIGTKDGSSVWGVGNTSTGYYATAWGHETTASNTTSTAWGNNAIASGHTSTAWGVITTASGMYSTAWGYNSTASGHTSTAFGYESKAYGGNSLAALGGTTGVENNTAKGANAVAIGAGALAQENGTFAIGNGAKATAANALAFGNGATASHANSIAIGANSATTADNVVSFGSDSVKRKLVNIAGGTLSATSAEAVSGAQLYATNANVAQNKTDIATNKTNIAKNTTAIATNTANIAKNTTDIATNKTNIAGLDTRVKAVENDAIKYNGADKKQVELAGADGTKITNVANGEFSAISTDAVNGKQLYSQVQILQGEIAQIISGGDPSFVAVVYDKDSDHKRITLAGIDGTTISHVKAGTLSATSTEAVNGAQLYATNEKIAQNAADIATNRTNIANNATAIETNKANIAKNTTGIATNKANIEGLDTRVTVLEKNGGFIDMTEVYNRVDKLSDRVEAVGANAAALAALRPMDMDDGSKFGMAIGTGVYRSKAAGAVGVFYRPNDNIMLSLGGSTSGSETMANFGISFALDKNVKRMPSRKVLFNKVEELEGIVAQQAAENAEIKEENAEIKAENAALKARLERIEAMLFNGAE